MSVLKTIYESEVTQQFIVENSDFVSQVNSILVKKLVPRIKQYVAEMQYEFVDADLEETFENIKDFTSATFYYAMQEAREVMMLENLSNKEKLEIISEEVDPKVAGAPIRKAIMGLQDKLREAVGPQKEAIQKQIDTYTTRLKEIGGTYQQMQDKIVEAGRKGGSVVDAAKDIGKGALKNLQERPGVALAGAGALAAGMAANRYLKARKAKMANK
jgi:hypothetical protein